jgi:sulfite reductase (ferredoxin)
MYKLPNNLDDDITKFATLAKKFTENEISATEFKAFRVPMGVYEQRENGIYMVRIRATGGVLYPEHLKRIINIAREAHSNLLHITTRQEIQIQNLQLTEVESVLRKLKTAGLASKGGGGNTVRNILVAENSGLTDDQAFDPTPYAMQLTSKMIAEADSYLMPRKLKIAFSNSEQTVDYAAVNDLGFVAKIKDGKRGFKVYAGGGAGSKPTLGWLLYDFIPTEQLYAVAGGVKRFFYENGNRKNRSQARLRFIFYKWGVEETLAKIKEYIDNASQTEPVFHLEEEVEDNTINKVDIKVEQTNEASFGVWKKRYTKIQNNGYATVFFPIVTGNIWINDEQNVDRWLRLLDFIDQFGKDTFRFTPSQSIRFRNLPEEILPNLYNRLKEINQDIDYPLLVNNIVTCTGADTCRQGICFSKGLAGAIRKKLLKSEIDLDKLQDVKLQISGCPNLCGQPLWGDLGFVGKVLRTDHVYPAYQINLGATHGETPNLAESVGTLNARDIPNLVLKLFEDYIQSGEQVSFNSYIQDKGKEKAKSLVAQYATIPLFEDDKNYYFDWGSDEVFSVNGKGKPECAASLFDLINIDSDKITESRKKLAETNDAKERTLLLEGILFAASHMLLVTKGLEPRSEQETYQMFNENFVKAGLVDASFESLIDSAYNNKLEDITTKEREVLALADAIITLYQNMDDSLQFKTEKPAQTAQPTTQSEPKTEHIKDLRGVLCPMNFVKTKIALAPLQSGDLLEIWLDDGKPIDNVPGSVSLEGHSILRQEQTPEGYWKVVIRKK